MFDWTPRPLRPLRLAEWRTLPSWRSQVGVMELLTQRQHEILVRRALGQSLVVSPTTSRSAVVTARADSGSPAGFRAAFVAFVAALATSAIRFANRQRVDR